MCCSTQSATVLCGDNGSGKSGYASSLKRDRRGSLPGETSCFESLHVAGALADAGLDVSGLTLTSIQPDRLTFANDFALRQFQAAVGRNAEFICDLLMLESEHPGMARRGYRQAPLKYSLQLGFGDDGAFADIDIWNPLFPGIGPIMHKIEVASNKRHGTTTNQFAIARGLGKSVVGHDCW